MSAEQNQVTKSKIYVVFWGFRSCVGEEFDSVWTDEALLTDYLLGCAKSKRLDSRGLHSYGDGDYFVYATEIVANSEFPYGE